MNDKGHNEMSCGNGIKIQIQWIEQDVKNRTHGEMVSTIAHSVNRIHASYLSLLSKAMRNCFFYAITSYAEFRISVITNQRKYTEINPIYEPT